MDVDRLKGGVCVCACVLGGGGTCPEAIASVL